MGGRDLAVGMSRWDRSPIGNGGGVGFLMPLQGRDGVYLCVSRVSARTWAQEFCGILRGRWAICEGCGHSRFLMGRRYDYYVNLLYEIEKCYIIRCAKNYGCCGWFSSSTIRVAFSRDTFMYCPFPLVSTYT